MLQETMVLLLFLQMKSMQHEWKQEVQDLTAFPWTRSLCYEDIHAQLLETDAL